jgi:GH25 family lysozyme M1 (1,4-beta-N-acetylmuramidase)
MGLCMLGALSGVGVMPAAAGQMAYIEGVDVSHYQGSPDWAAAKADGVRFVIAKATEGQNFVDDQYANNMAQADSLLLPFTAYHFARPDTTANDAVLEADHFLAVAALQGKHLVPVLDLEATGGLGPKKLRTWAKAWLVRVRDVLGVKATIYTSPAFWHDKMGNSQWFANNGYRLWIAHHGASQPLVPASNWGGRGWTFWQYTDEGSVSGISGNVDRDYYSGTTFGPLKIKNNR